VFDALGGPDPTTSAEPKVRVPLRERSTEQAVDVPVAATAAAAAAVVSVPPARDPFRSHAGRHGRGEKEGGGNRNGGGLFPPW